MEVINKGVRQLSSDYGVCFDSNLWNWRVALRECDWGKVQETQYNNPW